MSRPSATRCRRCTRSSSSSRGGMLLLQGTVEIVRLHPLPARRRLASREADGEEVDVDKPRMVHVKDEDIAALDAGRIEAGARK